MAQKTKLQRLGLLNFLEKLSKLHLLTERFLHQCIKILLNSVGNSAGVMTESLCKLLAKVGEQLDVPQAKIHMDFYFGRTKELAIGPKITSRFEYKLLVGSSDAAALRIRVYLFTN
jgi:translation initiation factor 4G